MLTKISVENYRAFREDTTFELAPITILLGANSSGKSSITRLFPLLNQSLSVRTSAPILWVTDELDYGSYADNVTRQNPSDPIQIGMAGEVHPIHVGRVFSSSGSIQLRPTSINYRLMVSSLDGRTFLSGLLIQVYGESVLLKISPAGYLVGVIFRDNDYSPLLRDRRIFVVQGMFPSLYAADKDGTLTMSSMREFALDGIRTLRNSAHQNTSFQTIQSAISASYLGTIAETFASIKTNTMRIPTLNRNIDYISDLQKQRIWISLFLSNINSIIQMAQRALTPDISGGSYLAPVRASAQRYYRRQELAVDKIDPAGGNLAMYLNSLGWGELDQLNADLVEFFDHSIQLTRGEGHISLRLGARDGSASDNLADVGFGFSQLLPVIAQIYAARRNIRSPARVGFTKSNSTLAPIIAIEQPELHLHPAYQSRLGMYFGRMIRRSDDSGPNFRFLIETHSEPLVNQVASMIGQGEISPDDVRLYLFGQREEDGLSEVIEAKVQSDGSIPNWPFGFFASGRVRHL